MDRREDAGEVYPGGGYAPTGGGSRPDTIAELAAEVAELAAKVEGKVDKDDFSSLELPDTATQKEVKQMLQNVLGKLKGLSACAAVLLSFAAFAIDPDIVWEDIPPTNKVRDVVEPFAPAPGNYAVVSNAAMNAVSRAEAEAGWWSEWTVSPVPDFVVAIVYNGGTWYLREISNPEYPEDYIPRDEVDGREDATELYFSVSQYTATRHRVAAPVPTKPEDIGAQPLLTFDTTPTAGSENPVTSGGVKTALDGKASTNTVRQLDEMATARRVPVEISGCTMRRAFDGRTVFTDAAHDIYILPTATGFRVVYQDDVELHYYLDFGEDLYVTLPGGETISYNITWSYLAAESDVQPLVEPMLSDMTNDIAAVRAVADAATVTNAAQSAALASQASQLSQQSQSISTLGGRVNVIGPAATNYTDSAIADADTSYRRFTVVTNVNQSVQYIVLDASQTSLAIELPSTGETRDWIVYVYAAANAALSLPSGVTWWTSDAANTNAIDAATPTALYFSQISTNIFLLGRQTLTEVAP